MKEEIEKLYGNKLRVRVCGICLIDEKLLLIKHHNLSNSGILWAPPGGGVQFGESLKDSLVREYKEETGLKVRVEEFLFINEFLSPPLHAIELFFKVLPVGGDLQLGSDPEMPADKQLLHDIQLFSFEEIRSMNPEIVHGALLKFDGLESLLTPNGLLK